MDRRPLDPPPVVQLKMFEVFHAGTDRQQEEEMEYELSFVALFLSDAAAAVAIIYLRLFCSVPRVFISSNLFLIPSGQ